jgi:hypothetical protein
LTEQEIRKNKIENDQKYTEYAGQNCLSFAEKISGKNNREEEKIKKSKLVMDQKSDGQNTDKHKDDQSQLGMPEEKGLKPYHHSTPPERYCLKSSLCLSLCGN